MKTMDKMGRKNLRLPKSAQPILVFLCGGMMALGCKARDPDLSAPLYETTPVGLDGSIALRDTALERMVFVSSPKKGELSTKSFPLGQGITAVMPSADKTQLFVLSKGVFPRIEEDDEAPSLAVFSGGSNPKLERTFSLDDPMTKLALDPKGEWVAAYAGDATVTNPNELVLLSLTGSDDKPVSKTIRSFGGSPVELVFTEELTVPQGDPRRFMVVRTDRDITLVDLSDLSRDEVTIRLPEDDAGTVYKPLQIVYDDGELDQKDDARLAVRLEGTADVVLLQLGKSESKSKDFAVVVNIVDVGGAPSVVDFVRTDGGLRLAALVPTALKATLVDPETTLAESVELPYRFNQMTRITSSVSDTPQDGDVALLWGASNQIAFWSLGETSSTPYRSIDSNDLPITVSSVIDVPSPNEHLKVLEGSGETGFFVLDLNKRQSFPLNTKGASFNVQASLDGKRLWASQKYSQEFSAIDLENLHPAQLYVSAPVTDLFDIARPDGGRSAVALHLLDGWAATVLDAESPSSAQTYYFSALELEGLQ